MWLAERLLYDGSQIRPLWARRVLGVEGSCGIAWRGPMSVRAEEMVDVEDLSAGAAITGDDVLHFRLEFFDDPSPRLTIYRQRLFAVVAAEALYRRYELLVRREGSDLYVDNRKLSVSAATFSTTSAVVHFGINLTKAGVPEGVTATGLCELLKRKLDNDRVRELALTILNAFRNELEDVESDLSKYRTIG